MVWEPQVTLITVQEKMSKEFRIAPTEGLMANSALYDVIKE